MKIANLFAGPGTGKSTTAAALFAELKYRGVNCEYIQEYAKDGAWEKRGPKLYQCQEYIFGKQHFRLFRTASEVDIIVTDSPILQSIVYCETSYLPSLKKVIREAHDRYDNLNIFLKRAPSTVKKYNQAGRFQTESEAQEKDHEILDVLHQQQVEFHSMEFGRGNPLQIISLMNERGWNVPAA